MKNDVAIFQTNLRRLFCSTRLQSQWSARNGGGPIAIGEGGNDPLRLWADGTSL